MARFIVPLVLILAIITLVYFTFAQKREIFRDSDPNLLLPDLQILPPKQLYLEEADGARNIRFSTTIVNKGQGPLELIGTHNSETDKTQAKQMIFKKDGQEERRVGEFIFHEGHDHWHFEKFDLFELWSLKDGKTLDKIIASTDKMSFCIQDEEILPEDISGKVEGAVYSDCTGEKQGISVGWSDTYEAELEGQVMDISNVPDGDYAFKSTVDPDNLIKEINDQNNSDITFIKIETELVERLENP